MAKENGLRFVIMKSSRWLSKNDPLMPSAKNRIEESVFN
jgi:hypothetical protein